MDVIEDYANVVVELIVGEEDPVRISNYKPNDEGCVELFYTRPGARSDFLFFLKGLPVSINLLRRGEYVFSEPVECAIGTKNERPDIFLSWETFCERTLPPTLDISPDKDDEEDEEDEEDEDDDEDEEEEDDPTIQEEIEESGQTSVVVDGNEEDKDLKDKKDKERNTDVTDPDTGSGQDTDDTTFTEKITKPL